MLRTTRYAWLVDWNPLAAFIELFRAPLLYGDFPGAIAVAVAGGSTLMIAAAATLTLARLQQKIIFQL
jgi:ABC-type polysaccharide/polyol phosphate export permease